MQSAFDFYEIREVTENDLFATNEVIGFIYPVLTRFQNDCKLSIVKQYEVDGKLNMLFRKRVYFAQRCKDYKFLMTMKKRLA